MRAVLQSGRAEQRGHRGDRSRLRRRHRTAEQHRRGLDQGAEEAVPGEPGCVRGGALHRRAGTGAGHGRHRSHRAWTEIRRGCRVDPGVSVCLVLLC